MAFSSPQFLIFFILVCGLNFVLKNSARKHLLLIASLVFIGWFNFYTLGAVIFFSGFTFFIAGRVTGDKGAFIFYSGLMVNCLAIVLFNYLLASGGLVIFSLNAVDFSVSALFLFVGLSFYNLQHVAYLVDVRKKRILAEKNFFDFLLISSYFPKFISGPLTLYQQLRPQINGPAPQQIILVQGFNRMLLGFFKKMVLADRLAPSVASVFDYNDELPGITVMSGAILFTIQLYFDFSGYCDMAIGASKMLGIELPENFDFPLRAGSVTEFWRKWHRSLIHFFTTYIFYPVSFRYRRFKKQAAAIAVILTFFVSALWHGIGFTFMMWACCHMVYLLFELYFGRGSRPGKLRRFISVALVLLLVSFGNIFFRSTSSSGSMHLLSRLFTFDFLPENWAVELLAPIAVGGHQAEQFNLAATLFFVFFTLLFERKIFEHANVSKFRPLITFLVILVIFVFGVFGNAQRFIYMQF
ncbi:MAG: MBOAT family O-acyltransferase [Bacteroidota bacterium]